ncbi:MAG TPA: hypothetical protein VGE74_05760 [Gemmata sp.]
MLKLTGHKKDVRGVTFAPDGRAVSCGSDRTVRVWNPLSGECLTSIKTVNVTYAVAVPPDGSRIAFAGRPGRGETASRVFACDLDGRNLGHHTARTLERSFQFDPVARVFVGGDPTPVARTVWALSFSVDGQYLAAAVRKPGGGNMPDGAGGFFWRTGTTGEADVLPGDDIYALAFAPQGHGIAVTRKGIVVFLPNVAGANASDAVSDGRVGRGYRFSASWSPAVAFVPGGESAVIASNSFLEFVNPVRERKPVRVKSGIRTITALAAAPDGQTLLVAGRPGSVEVYDAETRVRRTVYDFGLGSIHALAYSPDGLTFAAAGDNGLVVCDVAE